MDFDPRSPNLQSVLQNSLPFCRKMKYKIGIIHGCTLMHTRLVSVSIGLVRVSFEVSEVKVGVLRVSKG